MYPVIKSKLIAQIAKISASVRSVIVNGLTPTKGSKASSTAPTTTSAAVAGLFRAFASSIWRGTTDASVLIASQATRP